MIIYLIIENVLLFKDHKVNFEQVGNLWIHFVFEFYHNAQRWQCWHFCIAYLGESKLISVKNSLPVRIELWTTFDQL